MITIGKEYDVLQLHQLVSKQEKAVLEASAKEKVADCQKYLSNKIKESKKPIYGINTGFGSLFDTEINHDSLTLLQENLLRSHACGFGAEVPKEIVRLMLVLKAQSLVQGFSGVQLQTVELLLALYNNDILPILYEQGSLGASGDLAPLAHLALPLIGEGEVLYKNKKRETADVFVELNLTPITLEAKEGLALINGTQFMQAYGVFALAEAKKLIYQANLIGAMSFDAFDCNISPFLPQSHAIRRQKGQIKCAAEIYSNLDRSEIVQQKGKAVQDPYSFRCMPQVHGATYDAINNALDIFNLEINAVTDNPNIFPEDDLIISAGNFHGQTLALQLDFLSIALAELASISERRIYKLISGERNLPAYLVANPGLNSGFMIAQYTAASIVSQNKQLCTPASVDSIVSSNGQEDHVSMGANAATKTYRVVQNVNAVLQIEMMTAYQGLHFRNPLKSSVAVEKVRQKLTNQIEIIKQDLFLSKWLQKVNKDEVL